MNGELLICSPKVRHAVVLNREPAARVPGARQPRHLLRNVGQVLNPGPAARVFGARQARHLIRSVGHVLNPERAARVFGARQARHLLRNYSLRSKTIAPYQAA